MLEGQWDAVPPQLFTANGTAVGQIQVADTAGFRVKQIAFLKNNTFAAVNGVPVQIKRVLSKTRLIVGYVDQKINAWKPLDLTGFTVIAGSYIGAEQQVRTATPPGDEHYNAIYESDPVIADRVISVDKYGNFYDSANPVPTIPGGDQIAPPEFDEVFIERDCEDSPTQYQFYLAGVSVGNIDVSYNLNKSAIRYKKS